MAERRPLYIFDLDGTIADASHRQPILDEKYDPQRWRRFYAACDRDRPVQHVIQTMERLRRFSDVWFFSGRSDEVREKTVTWLARHTSFLTHEIEPILTMRQEGDHRADDELKREWFNALPYDDRMRLCAVFEDRDRVVAMWREAGVACYQVAKGDF